MFRKEFATVIAKTGMIPAKDLRPLLQKKENQKITEFEVLEFDFFDDLKFAKQVAENYEMTFLDLSQMRIEESVLSLIKKSDVLTYRCIPSQKTSKFVSLAVYDPSVMDIKDDLQMLFQHPVEFILTNLSS